MQIHKGNLFYKTYLIGFLIILALPLLNWPTYFSPPNWAKTIVFQIIFSVILFLFLCQFLWSLVPTGSQNGPANFPIRKTLYPINRKNLAFWLLLALFVAQLLATIFSLDFKYSFFGSPYRGGGFISYGFYILFAAITFWVVKDKDWQKLWDFSILIGVLVSILALISRFGLFRNIFIARVDNLSSTIGGPNTLGLYMLLLIFPALIFGIKEHNKAKKIFYFLSFALFCFIVLLTISQGAYLALAAGTLYFFILYPTKNLSKKTRKWVFYSKIIFVAVMFLAVIVVLLIKSNPDIKINQNYLFRHLTTWKIDQSRLSTWQVAWQAFLHRPLLGYGPENFSIGFDRYYDPTLPLLRMAEGAPNSWWDKAHNFALNLFVETGILGFIAFALLFLLIFWGLNKLIYQRQLDSKNQPALASNSRNIIIAHGLLAALVAYFINLSFNFENFASYILAFLIIGYSLHLIIEKKYEQEQKKENSIVSAFLFKGRQAIAAFAFVLLIGFMWFFVAKPFQANAQINKAVFLADNKRCDQAIYLMNQELKKHSIIDGYLGIKYVDIIKVCLRFYPANNLAYVKNTLPVLEESVKIRPYYTRSWLTMVAFNNMLAVSEQDPEKKKAIIDQSREWLKKAKAISPDRHEVLVETINFEIFGEGYDKAKQLSEDCIKKYPDFNACYWYLGLSQIYLSKDKSSLEEGKRNMEKAQAMGYFQLSQYSLGQLALLYINKKDYKELEWVYERLTESYPENSRYFAFLAMVYKKNGEIEESTKAFKEVLRIQTDVENIKRGWTESESVIEVLLENIIGFKKDSSSYHLTLWQAYLEIGRLENAKIHALKYYNFYVQEPSVKDNPELLAQAKKKLNSMLNATKN